MPFLPLSMTPKSPQSSYFVNTFAKSGPLPLTPSVPWHVPLPQLLPNITSPLSRSGLSDKMPSIFALSQWTTLPPPPPGPASEELAEDITEVLEPPAEVTPVLTVLPVGVETSSPHALPHNSETTANIQ